MIWTLRTRNGRSRRRDVPHCSAHWSTSPVVGRTEQVFLRRTVKPPVSLNNNELIIVFIALVVATNTVYPRYLFCNNAYAVRFRVSFLLSSHSLFCCYWLLSRFCPRCQLVLDLGSIMLLTVSSHSTTPFRYISVYVSLYGGGRMALFGSRFDVHRAHHTYRFVSAKTLNNLWWGRLFKVLLELLN